MITMITPESIARGTTPELARFASKRRALLFVDPRDGYGTMLLVSTVLNKTGAVVDVLGVLAVPSDRRREFAEAVIAAVDGL